MENSIEKPFVSIIIPVLNEAEQLSICLTALSKQTYPESKYEIIVVDNGTTETVPKTAANFAEVKYLKEPHGFSYNARNTGIHNASSEFLAFTDADCIPENDWLENGINRFLNEKNCGIVGGKIEFFFLDNEKPNAVELYESFFYLEQKIYIEELNFSTTANLFTHKKVFDKAGLFQIAMTSGGDYEFGNRVIENGLRIVYEEKAIVKHPARNNLIKFLNKERRIRGGAISLEKYNKNWVNSQEIGIISGAFPPLKRIVSIFSGDKPENISDKIKVAGILCLTHYVKWFETWRLKFGGKPLR